MKQLLCLTIPRSLYHDMVKKTRLQLFFCNLFFVNINAFDTVAMGAWGLFSRNGCLCFIFDLALFCFCNAYKNKLSQTKNKQIKRIAQTMKQIQISTYAACSGVPKQGGMGGYIPPIIWLHPPQ